MWKRGLDYCPKSLIWLKNSQRIGVDKLPAYKTITCPVKKCTLF